MFHINLYQSTGEIQSVFSSDSKDEITQLWKQECSTTDEYTELDDLLTLSNDDVVIDFYKIPTSQQQN